MIVYSLLLVSCLLAIISLLFLRESFGRKIRDIWDLLLLSLSLGMFIYLYGTWVFLSIYIKYLFAACFSALFIAIFIIQKTKISRERKRNKIILNLLFAALLSTLSVLYFTGTTGKPYGVANIAFPFKKGTYLVFQGGKGLPTNLFHYSFKGAVYAMDIIKLNEAGNRAKHIFSKRLEDYETFNDTIYSPCSGLVMRSKDDNPDNIPPNRERGPSNTNQVLLATDSFYVFMGHMKQHCVFVQEGQRVVQGQPLGCAGNSGFSLEPHLHIQVHARTNPNIPWYKEPPLWIEFDGKSYLLFQEIKAKK